MHELSICTCVAEIVQRHSEGRHVVAVQVRVGQLRQIVPESMTFCWTAITQQTPLAGSVLDIEQVPAQIECHRCHGRTVLTEPLLRCPACASHDIAIVGGQEFLITSIEVDDPTGPDDQAAPDDPARSAEAAGSTVTAEPAEPVEPTQE